jgi:hypothetical protein
MIGKVFAAADQLADVFFERLPPGTRRAKGRAGCDSFLYRLAQGVVLYAVAWVKSGSPARTRHDRVHNDIVDIAFATFATYFNGLMSQDTKALNLYWNLRGALMARGGTVPPDFVDRFGTGK